MFNDFNREVAMCRYFAEEPNYTPDGHPYAPSKFEVWTRRNLPTFIVGLSLLNFKVQSHICNFTGHAWVDDSYGGSESGCMTGHCSRCGESFHTQLY